MEKLKPEEKVNLAINMTDACVRICADSIKDQDGTIKEEELLESYPLIRADFSFGDFESGNINVSFKLCFVFQRLDYVFFRLD